MYTLDGYLNSKMSLIGFQREPIHELNEYGTVRYNQSKIQEHHYANSYLEECQVCGRSMDQKSHLQCAGPNRSRHPTNLAIGQLFGNLKKLFNIFLT